MKLAGAVNPASFPIPNPAATRRTHLCVPEPQRIRACPEDIGMRSHPTTTSDERQSPTRELHEPEFRFHDFIVPADWITFLSDGRMSAGDFLVACVTRSLSRTKRGCFASNDYVGRAANLHPVTVSKSLRKLADLGILSVRKEGRRRGVYFSENAKAALAKTLNRTNTYGISKKVEHCRRNADAAATPPCPPVPPDEVVPARTKSGKRRYSQKEPDSPVPERAAAPPHSPDQRGGMFLIDQEQVSSPQDRVPVRTHGEQHLRYAERLKAKVVTLPDYIPRRINLYRWADYFAKLEKQVGFVRLNEVLTWYCEKGILPAPYRVEAFSGKSFREKFSQIVSAMDRDRKNNPTVTVSPQAEKITAYLTTYHTLPEQVLADLPTAVQMSLTVYEDFRTRCRKSAHPAARKLLAEVLLDPAHDVRNRYDDWCRWIVQKKYTGRLIPRFVITPTDEKLVDEMRRAAGSAWPQLEKELFRAD